MASTVKVPLFGQVNKGTVVGVSIGGFAVAGFLIYRAEKKKKAQSAAAAAASAQSQAASGYGYGAAGLNNGYYGYGEPSPYGAYGYGAMGAGYTPGYYGYGTPIPQQAAPITTNAQWAQAAINQLSSEGYDAQAVSAALGAYELGQPVTAAQQTIIQSAIGIEGYPPQAGANGDPPGINVQGTPGGGTGGGQTGKTIVTSGNHSLLWYARSNGTTETQLIAWNPNLAQYDKPNTNVPNGLTIRVGLGTSGPTTWQGIKSALGIAGQNNQPQPPVIIPKI